MIILKILGLISYLVFFLSAAGTVISVMRGESRNIGEMVKMISNISAAIDHPLAALYIVITALTQIGLTFIFFFIGRALFRNAASLSKSLNPVSAESQQPDIRLK